MSDEAEKQFDVKSQKHEMGQSDHRQRLSQSFKYLEWCEDYVRMRGGGDYMRLLGVKTYF